MFEVIKSACLVFLEWTQHLLVNGLYAQRRVNLPEVESMYLKYGSIKNPILLY